MSSAEQQNGQSNGARMVILAVAGVVIVNAAGALLSERDTGLGLDDFLYVLGGLALAAIVEFGYFRRRG